MKNIIICYCLSIFFPLSCFELNENIHFVSIENYITVEIYEFELKHKKTFQSNEIDEKKEKENMHIQQ